MALCTAARNLKKMLHCAMSTRFAVALGLDFKGVVSVG